MRAQRKVETKRELSAYHAMESIELTIPGERARAQVGAFYLLNGRPRFITRCSHSGAELTAAGRHATRQRRSRYGRALVPHRLLITRTTRWWPRRAAK